jgi:mannosyltransferase OCH1-like enzyme
MMTKIPKKIHLVWVGTPRPRKYDFLVSEIKRINHDYEVIEWNDENIDFELINHDLYHKCENLGSKSDILRFELLYKYGGIYIDYDFLQIKKFDDLLDSDFFAGAAGDAQDEVWNSIVGAAPQSQVALKFLEGLSSTKPIRKNEIDRVMNETGPYYLKRILDDNHITEDVRIFRGKQFFPFPGAQRFLIRNLTPGDIEYARKFADESTYCIHLHTTAWQ